jgi:hypothetical protein
MQSYINHNNFKCFYEKICLLIILQVAVFTAFAQKLDSSNFHRPEPVNPIMDKQEHRGYIIRLKSENVGSYGFDILKDNKPVAHQFQTR